MYKTKKGTIKDYNEKKELKSYHHAMMACESKTRKPILDNHGNEVLWCDAWMWRNYSWNQ